MKKILALFLVLALAMSFVACINNGDSSTDTSTDTDTSIEETKMHEYIMSEYLTLSAYKDYVIDFELDTLQATIDKYLAERALEYSVKKGDDVYVDIIYHEVVRSVDQNGAPIDQRGEEITELKKNDFLIENVGAGSYLVNIENALIGRLVKTAGASPNIQNTVTQRILLPNDFYAEQWRGREVFIDMTLVSKECKLGDIVLADYTGYLLDQETLKKIPDDKGGYKTFDSSTGVEFFLGSHLAIEDFEQGIVGTKINETVSFNATFPDDYFNNELKGQTVEFEVTVTKIYNPPKYDNTFTKEYFDKDSVGDFEKALKDKHIQNQLFEYINKSSVVISYPQSEYKRQQKKLQDIEQSWEAEYGITLDSYIQNAFGMTRDEYIKSNMKYKMVYYAIAQAEGIVPTEAQLASEKESLIEYYYDYYISEGYAKSEAEKSANAMVEDLGEEYIYEEVIYRLVDERLIEIANVNYIPKTYTSITESQNN